MSTIPLFQLLVVAYHFNELFAIFLQSAFPSLLNVQVMMKKKMVENESSGDVRAAFKVFDQDGDG